MTNSRLPSLIALAAFALAPVAAPAQDAVGLGERQRELLLAHPDAAVAPTDLPADWLAARAVVSIDERGVVAYEIVYRSPDHRTCFAVEGGPPEGFGGPVPPTSTPVEIPALGPPAAGEAYRVYWTTEDDPEGPFPEPTVFSDWIESGGAAHRLTSPARSRPGCGIVDRETAIRAVASLAPLGPAVEPEVDPAALDLSRYDWLTTNHPFIEADEGETPAEIALGVLASFGLGLSAEQREGPAAVDERITVHESPGGETVVLDEDEFVVLVTRSGLRDDSVAAIRYNVTLVEAEPGVWEFRAGRQFRCQPGRGHREWSTEFCL